MLLKQLVNYTNERDYHLELQMEYHASKEKHEVEKTFLSLDVIHFGPYMEEYDKILRKLLS